MEKDAIESRCLLQSEIGDFPFTGELESVRKLYFDWRDRFLDQAADNPLETLLTLVLTSAWLLYQAEKEVNEGLDTYDDAIYYVSTCLSVGYANVFPRTQVGKLIAAVVMMIGPSLSSWVVEGRLVRREREAARVAAPPLPAPGAQASAGDIALVVEKLDAILEELRAQRAQP